MADGPLNVLFLCTGNSARSIMAEAILNRVGGGKFKAFSAGSMPKGEVHPGTLEILRRNAFRPEDYRSKSWEEFSGPDAPKLDFVFTVCDNAANEVCPIWPGQPMTAHWGVPDPAAATGNAAEIALAFADSLPDAEQPYHPVRQPADREPRSPVPAATPRRHRQGVRQAGVGALRWTTRAR